MVLESEPDEPPSRGNSRRQLTRISIIVKFSQLECFTKQRNRIGFSKFKMLCGSFFNAVYKYALGLGFCAMLFLADLRLYFRISQNEKNCLSNLVATALPFAHVPSVCSGMCIWVLVRERMSHGIISGGQLSLPG